jgi:hypothetical protein
MAEITIAEESRECATCGVRKHITAFKYTRRDRCRSRSCKACQYANQQRWRHENPEKVKAGRARAFKAWRIKHPKLPPREAANSPNGRLCRTCGVRKKPEEFRSDKRHKDGLAWHCRECAYAGERLWRENNLEQYRDNARGGQRDRYRKRPEHYQEILRRSRIRTKYGIEVEDVERMLDAQRWQCAICEKKVVRRGFNRKLGNVACVDHNHETKKIRGILCSYCNRALGLFGDSAERLDVAARYLRGNLNYGNDADRCGPREPR